MATGGTGSLRATYVERWSGIRLWIHRTRHGTLAWGLLRRGSDNHVRMDTQLARGEAPCPPGSWASSSLPHALLSALISAYGDEFVRTCHDQLRRELASGAPSGGHRGYSTTPLTGPLP